MPMLEGESSQMNGLEWIAAGIGAWFVLSVPLGVAAGKILAWRLGPGTCRCWEEGHPSPGHDSLEMDIHPC